MKGLGTAISDRDPLALLSMIAPAQVHSLADVYGTAKSKSKDAGLIKENPFSGIDLSVDGLRLDESPLGDSAAAVTINGGALKYAVDPRSVAPGFRPDGRADKRSGSVAVADLDQRTIASEAPIITLKQNGRWYVSPADTAMEWWRRANNYPAADFTAEPPKSSGATSPEGVVSDLVKAVTDMDVNRLLDLASPDELGALYHYRAAINGALQEHDVVSDLRSEGSLSVDGLKTEVRDKKSSSATVVITSLSGGATSPDGEGARFSYEEGCLRVDTNRTCASDLAAGNGLFEGLARGLAGDLGIHVVKVDGRWYVSPVRTLSAVAERALGGLGRKEVLALTGARELAPAESTLGSAPVSATFASSGDFHTYDVQVPAGSFYRACTDTAGFDAFEPDGTDSDLVDDDLYRATQSGKHKVIAYTNRKGTGTISAAVTPSRTVAVGATMQGTVSTDPSSCSAAVYSVSLLGGHAYFLEGRGAASVVTPSGEQVGTSYVKPAATGTYLVIPFAGDYALRLKGVPASALAPGATRAGRVGASPVTYSLFAPTGQSLTMTVTSGVDTTLELLSSSGQRLAFNDDTNGSDPSITYSFPTGGLYRLRVASYTGAAGSFTITVGS